MGTPGNIAWFGQVSNTAQFATQLAEGRYGSAHVALLGAAKKVGGPIVIICSEGDCNKCHRKLIIEHLQSPGLFARYLK